MSSSGSATNASDPVTGDSLVVGRVAKAHGIRGEVVVEVLTDHDARFAPGSVLNGPGGVLTVRAARPHQERLLVRFDEVADRNGAEALRGAELTIPLTDAAPLPEGRWYEHQLIGLAVRTPAGQPLGVLDSVVASPAHDLWAVRTSSGARILVPAVEAIVVEVDLDARTITLDAPEGLF